MTPIRLQGDERFSLASPALVQKFTDARFLVACMPEVQAVEVTATRAAWSVPAGLTMVPGTLHVELSLASQSPTNAAFAIEARTAGASATASATLSFSEAENGTLVHWVAEVTRVTGLLRIVPNAILRGGIERAVPQIWERIRTRVDAAL